MMRKIHFCSSAVHRVWISRIGGSFSCSLASRSSSAFTSPMVTRRGRSARGLHRGLITSYITSGKLPCSDFWKPVDGRFQLVIVCAAVLFGSSPIMSTYRAARPFCLSL